MTKRERVIKGLKWCMNEEHDCYREKGCPYENEGEGVGCKYALHRDALALLKAQEPIAPNHVEDGNYETSGIMNYWFMCGKCGSCVDPGDKYCHECGQAVKWE